MRLFPLVLLAGSLFLWAPASGAQTFSRLADVAYDAIAGVDPSLLSLDVYRPTGVGPFPVVVFVHGGGWSTGDKASAVHAKPGWLAAREIMLVSVNYRLSPPPVADPDSRRITFPTHPEDVGRAVDFVRAQAAAWGGDAERLVVMGHSAGAHLAALVGTDPGYTQGDAPACVVALDTNAYDIPFYLDAGPSAAQTELYVNAFTDDRARQAAASPITHVGAWLETAVLVVHQDNPVYNATSARFLNVLQDAGHVAIDHPTNGLSHRQINVRLGTADAPDLTAAVGAFLDDCFDVSVGASAGKELGSPRVSPNPSDGRVRLDLPVDGAPYRVRVVGVGGRTVWRRHGVRPMTRLDLRGLAPGVYTIIARGRGREVRRRITVTR